MSEIIIKKRSLFNDLGINKNKNNDKKRMTNINNINLVNKKEVEIKKPPKPPNINIKLINFIKKKQRFFIEDSFDVKGTREFLASKEVAMRVIKLNDDIVEQNKNFTNKELLTLDFPKLDNNMNKRKSHKTEGKRTISPRKSRKSQQKMKLISNKQIISIPKLSDHKKLN